MTNWNRTDIDGILRAITLPSGDWSICTVEELRESYSRKKEEVEDRRTNPLRVIHLRSDMRHIKEELKSKGATLEAT